MINITTEYPIMKGDSETQLVSLQNTVCSLLDELKYILPQIGTNITVPGNGSGSGEESDT